MKKEVYLYADWVYKYVGRSFCIWEVSWIQLTVGEDTKLFLSENIYLTALRPRLRDERIFVCEVFHERNTLGIQVYANRPRFLFDVDVNGNIVSDKSAAAGSFGSLAIGTF